MFSIIFGLLGGVALFIYGMTEMGKGLQKAAGNKMRRVLEALTSVPVIGVLVGAGVTAIIQSSSATTVMVVGFVNAGLMNLRQSISVIMGANIGTTITGQIVAFNLTKYYLPMIAIGFIIFFVSKKKTVKCWGQILFAFGILFMGMDLMSSAMSPLREYEGFRTFMATFGEYHILGLLIGFALTAIIQSSSAAMGILIALSTQGLISLEAAIPIILGFNIGTCVTAIISSIGAKVSAKRAAAAHITFNVIGAVVVMFILPWFADLVLLLSPADNVTRQIANAHTIFNIASTLVLLPFVNVLAKLVTKLIKGEEKFVQKGPMFLDNRVLNNPPIALNLAVKEAVRTGKIAQESLRLAMDSFSAFSDETNNYLIETEDVIDDLEKDITNYLIKLPQGSLTENLIQLKSNLFHVINDMERIGDHADNLRELAELCHNENLPFTDYALDELEGMFELVNNNVTWALEALATGDTELAAKVVENEKIVDQMEKDLRRSHINRLNMAMCTPSSGVIFLDVISNLERVSDHSNNIAHIVIADY